MSKELVAQLKSNDRIAQRKLFDDYQKAMFNTCVRMLGNREDAKDVMQEAFISVFKNIQNFRGESTIGAWIKRIMVNHCINHLNKRKLIFDEMDEEYLNISEENSRSSKDENMPDMKLIHEAIKELPTKCRAVFNLYLLEGYDHEEIAGILNVSVSTSKTQYMRGKKLIHQQLMGQNGK